MGDLDGLQRAAVAETIHSPSSVFDSIRFRAKYGQDPNWCKESEYGGYYSYDSKPSSLCLFLHHGMVPEDLKSRLLKFVPEPRKAAIAVLDRLPPTCETQRPVWRLEFGQLLAAIAAGRQVEEICEFLAARRGVLPDTAEYLLYDVAARTMLFLDRGLARLVECADGTLAELVANDTRARRLCMRAGERHPVVTGSEAAFRRALRDAGFLLTGTRNAQRKSRTRTGSRLGDNA